MSKYICVDRKKDKYRVVKKFVIMEVSNGNYYELEPFQIKNLLLQDSSSISNLKLTSDNKVRLVNSEFQDNVDKHNKKHEGNALVDNAEKVVDNLLENIVNYSKSKGELVSLCNLNTSGDTNTFSVYIKNSSIGFTDSMLIVRYRKDISKLGSSNYKAKVIVGVVGIKSADKSIKFSENREFTLCSVTGSKSSVKDVNIGKCYNKLLDYIADTCGDECAKRKIELKRGKDLKSRLKRVGVTSFAIAMISVSVVGLTAYSGGVTTTNAISSEVNYRVFSCNYKFLSLGTKITTTLNDKNIEITGNILPVVTDPLTMKDEYGNIIAEATDNYNMFNEDDHAILVNNKVEVVMRGDFNIIGRSYDLYNDKNQLIGTFERDPVFSSLGYVYNNKGVLIAEYNRHLFFRDYSVTIYDDSEISDESLLMIMASFVSDEVYASSTN